MYGVIGGPMSDFNLSEMQTKLDKLLKRERAAGSKQTVDDIAASELTIDEKIRRIQEIDSREFQTSLDEEPVKPKDIEDAIRRNGIVTFEEASKFRDSIKRPYIRRPFLIFIISDIKRVRAFGEKTGLVRSGMLPPNVRLEKIAKDEMTSIRSLCVNLLPTVISVLKVAWMYLPKLDYNLLAAFRNLCEAMAGTNFETLDFGEKKLITRLKLVETAYLVCAYKPEYAEIIAGSLSLILDKYPRYADKSKNVSDSVRKVLDVKHPRSLYNILSAINMTAYRRYVVLKDVYEKTCLESVPTYGYDCDDTIQTRISMRIEEEVQKLIALRRTKDEAQRIQNSIGQFVTTGDGSYDYGLLKSFYKSSKTDDNNFAIDSKNVSVFSQNLFHLYSMYFEEFLTGRVSVRDYGQVKAFSGDFCASEFQAIKAYSEELAQAYFSYPNFPIERYVSLKDDANQKPTHSEEPVYKFILELTNLTVRIGKKLAAVSLYRDKKAIDDGGQFVQITTAVLQSHNATVPHWDKPLFSAGYLDGRTFGDALTYVASLSLLIGVFFRDDNLTSLLNRESALNQKIEELYFELERLGDTATFEKIRKKYFPSYDIYFF